MEKEQILFIEIKDGRPFGYPSVLENLICIFPDINGITPPPGFARCIKTEPPVLVPGEIIDSIDWVLDEKYTNLYNTPVWKELYNIRLMNADELDQFVIKLKQHEPWKQNWNFDFMTMSLVAPKPHPNDGQEYIWLESKQDWVRKPKQFPEMIKKIRRQVLKKFGFDIETGDIQSLDKKTTEQIQQVIDEITAQY